MARSRDEAEEQADEVRQTFRNPALQSASDALQAIARDMVVSDYYEDLTERVHDLLDGPLAAFNATGDPGKTAMSPHGNTLALLLAVVTDLVLSHYYWLVKTQPAVAPTWGSTTPSC